MDEYGSIHRVDLGHAGRARRAGGRLRLGDDETMNGYEFESDDDVPKVVPIAVGVKDVVVVSFLFAFAMHAVHYFFEAVRLVSALLFGG